MILAMCRQFHCLPSALLAEDSELIQMLAIEHEAGGPDDQ